MGKTKQEVSQVIQVERRWLLIDATISAIYEYGLSSLTLSKITNLAGLTAATVNFHFDSKEALLLETLKHLTEEFDQSLEDALALAGSDPVNKLTALVDASLDIDITESRKMAVWFAFLSEGRNRKDYQRICGDCDSNNRNITAQLCQQILDNSDQGSAMNASNSLAF